MLLQGKNPDMTRVSAVEGELSLAHYVLRLWYSTERGEWLGDKRTMRRALDTEVIVIFRSRLGNMGIVIIAAVLSLVVYR